MNFVEELRWRGMLQDIMPGTEDILNEESTRGYIGFDPTGDSLHVGHLTQIMTLIHFQRAGHKPFALVGGATGMVGDPSGKSSERNLLDEETLAYNVSSLEKQLKKFLDFEGEGNSAEMVNNFDWFKDISFLSFIRDVGKHLTVNYMMAKDSVKKRIEGESGISFTEFSYQLIQGYDYYHLWKNKNCKVQMGGSDQWGNIVTGTELIRRIGGGDNAFGLTTQLIKKADGNKFGKSEGGAIWLDPSKTSPFRYYQFWLNSSDEDVKNWIKIFTLKSKEEIEAIIAEHDLAPHERIVQKALAKDITIRTHDQESYETAIKTSDLLFGNGSIEFLDSLDHEEVLDVFDGIPQFKISKKSLEAGVNIIELLADTGIFPSKGEARKMIQGGGVMLNKEKVQDVDQSINVKDLINYRYLLFQKGKKNYFLVIAE